MEQFIEIILTVFTWGEYTDVAELDNVATPRFIFDTLFFALVWFFIIKVMKGVVEIAGTHTRIYR